MLKDEVKKELCDHILPFWMGLADNEYGGYYGFMDVDLKLDKKADKGCILNSRILWTFSHAYTLFKKEEYLESAKRAYDFFKDAFLDYEGEGIFWSVTYDGKPKDTTKHSYNTAFAIYALSAYYEASRSDEALWFAERLFNLIEDKYRDEYGYKEAFSRNFKPIGNEHLSENGIIAEKTMNTMLHIFEAYTELYRVSGNKRARECMYFIADIFRDKIYNKDMHRLEVFFDEKMNSLINLHSYGHDIETAWLLEHGLRVLRDEEYHNTFADMLCDLEREILKVAYDGKCVTAESENGIVKENRIWWVQCESILGFVNAYGKRGEDEFKDAALNIWEYIKKYFIDYRNGSEWYNERLNDERVNAAEPVLSPWKCPYHNSRMCFEIIRSTVAI